MNKIKNKKNETDFLRKTKGFSLLELILTVVLLSVITSMSINVYTGYKSSSDIESDLSLVLYALKTARIKAISGENFSDWGIHIDKSPGNNSMEIYYGNSYTGTAEETFYISDYTQFGEFKENGMPVSGDIFDVQFTKINGNLLSGSDKEINLSLKNGAVGVKTVKINKKGTIITN